MNTVFSGDNSEKPSHNDPINKILRQPKHLSLHEIKADLYSIILTVDFLSSRYKKGLINRNLYLKRMRTFYRDLRYLTNKLKSWNLDLFQTANSFDIPLITSSSINHILSKIFNVPDINSVDEKGLKLSGQVAEITSHFITLIDYFHITEHIDFYMVIELINELAESMQGLSVFESFFKEINTLRRYISSAQKKHLRDEKIIRSLEDAFYNLFQEFKAFLSE